MLGPGELIHYRVFDAQLDLKRSRVLFPERFIFFFIRYGIPFNSHTTRYIIRSIYIYICVCGWVGVFVSVCEFCSIFRLDRYARAHPCNKTNFLVQRVGELLSKWPEVNNDFTDRRPHEKTAGKRFFYTCIPAPWIREVDLWGLFGKSWSIRSESVRMFLHCVI